MNPKPGDEETLKRKPFWRNFINKYTLVLVGFLVWMFFFDENSYFVHKETDEEIQALKQDQKYYKRLLDKERVELNKIKTDPMEAERIAREKFYMKKRNEEVFLIERKDSTATKEN